MWNSQGGILQFILKIHSQSVLHQHQMALMIHLLMFLLTHLRSDRDFIG